MGGHGHGPHIVGNERNMQETDEAMLSKIQRIDLIKFNPNHFHMQFWSVKNWFDVIGGAPTACLGAVGAVSSLGYYQAAGTHRNFFTNNMRASSRLFVGLTLGLALGYTKFGDRQRLHNAYIAERLRRRYPEAMDLHHHDLWKLKGVAATHEFYQWK